MNLIDLIIEAFSTLAVNKLRTSLAILGIVIGIGSVIALVSLGQASQQSIQSQIESLGANLLTVNPGSARSGMVRSAAGSITTLTNEDATALSTSPEITLIQTVSPEYSGRQQVTTGSTNANTQVIGVSPTYPIVHKTEVETGAFITDSHLAYMSKVAVIGPTTAETLFGSGVSPIGRTVRVSGQVFTIIGETKSKGGTGFQNQDDVIFIPLTTAQKQIYGSTHVTSIALEAKSAESMTAAQDQVGYFLLKRHKISDASSADFSIFSQQDILNTVSSTTGTFTALLSGVAAISLLVGGIGIMNIMLVTVTERTREIGLRKALGAKKRMITTQFLIESIALTCVGGALGMVVGIAISLGIAKLFSLPFVISPTSMLLAVVVSAGIGILFGWYPAKRAASLQPIDALRYE